MGREGGSGPLAIRVAVRGECMTPRRTFVEPGPLREIALCAERKGSAANPRPRFLGEGGAEGEGE